MKDHGYKHLYEKHLSCKKNRSQCKFCNSVICCAGKAEKRSVNFKKDDMFQVENEEMSCDNVSVNYSRLIQFYDERNKIDLKQKNDSFTTLIPPPLYDEGGKSRGVKVYITEINADFCNDDISPLMIQDPMWVNYDVDGHQARLDMPILSSVSDVTFEKIQFHWKRNCLLTSLKSIMNGYGSREGCFTDLKQMLNGVSMRFAEMNIDFIEYNLNSTCEKEEHLKNQFFEKFFMSVMVMCIKEGVSIINKSLKDRGREPTFKLLYSQNIVNLLSLLNTFRHSEKGSFANEEEESIINLSDVNLLKENVGSLIGHMLDERCDLLSEVSEKITFLRSSSSVNANIDRVTGLLSDIVNTHKGVVDLQTKMLVVQELFDLYKVISIELHRCVDYKSKYEFHDRGTDFSEQCPSCVNGYLMRNE